MSCSFRIIIRRFVALLLAAALVLGAMSPSWAKPRPPRNVSGNGLYIPPSPEVNPIYIIGNPPDINAPTEEDEVGLTDPANDDYAGSVREPTYKIIPIQDMAWHSLFGPLKSSEE